MNVPPGEIDAWMALQDIDDEVSTELRSMLDAHFASAKFLARNAVEISAKSLVDNDLASIAGTQIGDFRIVSEIGRGGMGAVYLATRTDDFDQTVALKVIKRGMDTDFIVRRFQNERQILSSLNHPNIAKLLDGGTTADGLPYFVMEYVEGESLRDYCASQNPSCDERLTLFRKICDAVSTAHRNLIVHRDLKPSNILVAANCTPKLLDFGIAKMLDDEGEGTERTTTEYRLLTPKYASPEQVRGDPVSTQSDVFSLGILFREMLDGRFGGEAMLDRELTVIADTATHEDTTRRYPSVDQFSDDIRRYLADLPINASSDGIVYRSRKFILRHRFGVAAAAVVLIVLIAGIAATLWQSRRAEQERSLAQARFNDVRALANSVIFDLHDEIQNLPGSTKARKLLVEKALEYLNKLQSDGGSDPGLQHELAMAYSKIADVQGQFFEASLLETDNAAVNYRKALELAEKAAASDANNFEFRRDLALICHRFAQFQRGGSDLTETLILENRSAEIFEKLVAENPTDAEIRRLWLISRRGYSDVMREAGELERSLPLYEQNLNLMLAALQDFPDDIKLRRFSAGIYGNYALALFLHDEKQKAFDNQMIAKGIAEQMNAVLKDDVSAVRGIGASCEDATKYAMALGNNSVAESSALEGIAIMERIAKDDAENLEAKYDAASLHNTYAKFLEQNNRWREALEQRQKVLETIAPVEKNKENPDWYTAEFFEFYARAALAAAKLGQREKAENYLARAQRLDFDITKGTSEVRNIYSVDLVAIGDTLVELGRKQDGINWYKKAVEVWSTLQTSDRFYPINAKNLADAKSKIDAVSKTL